jgi:hypothetical protein
LAGDELPGFVEGFEAVDFEIGDHGGFAGVFGGEEEAFSAGRFCSEGDGEGSFDRAKGSIEGEFPDDHEVTGLWEFFFLLASDHGEGDREIEGGAFFSEIGRGEVYGVDAVDEVHRGGEDGGGDAVAGFTDGGIREADDVDAAGIVAIGFTRGDFDLNLNGFDSAQGGTVDLGNHLLFLLFRRAVVTLLFCGV